MMFRMRNHLMGVAAATLLISGSAFAVPDTLPINVSEGGADWSNVDSDSDGGFNIQDASIPTGGSDAYDDALGAFVNDERYEPSTSVDNTLVEVDGSVLGRQITAKPETLDGLVVSQSFLFYRDPVEGSPTVRALYKIMNPGATDRMVELEVVGDLGSDSDSTSEGSSSGNQSLDRRDIWAISSDDADRNGSYSDPAVTHVIQSPECTIAKPLGANRGGEGFSYLYEFMVPAGESRYVAVFNQLRSNQDTIQDAINAAMIFESLDSIANAGLFSDLSEEQASRLVNFLREKSCGKVGDRVWYDLDSNGLQDDGEPGIPNISVLLKDGNGNTMNMQTTDNNGNYLFDGVRPGTYSVQYLLPLAFGATTSPQDVGLNDSLDSDVKNSDLSTPNFSIEKEEVDMTRDAGVFIPNLLDTDLDGTPNEYDDCPMLNPNDGNGNGIADCRFAEELKELAKSVRKAVRKLKKGKKSLAANNAASAAESYAEENTSGLSGELTTSSSDEVLSAAQAATKRAKKATTAAKKRAPTFGRLQKKAVAAARKLINLLS